MEWNWDEAYRKDGLMGLRLLNELSEDDGELAIKAIYQQISCFGKKIALHSRALVLGNIWAYISICRALSD